MSQRRGNLQHYAMLYGTYMGVFWILKFILLPLMPFVPLFSFLFMGLTLAVPFIGYYCARIYRETICEGRIGFVHAWLFTVFVYMFAALLTTVAHYIYFQYIDHGHLLQFFLSNIEEARKVYPEDMQSTVDTMIEAMNLFFEQTPIYIALQIMANNVYYGAILAVPTALFVMKKGKPVVTP